MKYNYNQILNKEICNKCLIRNLKGKNICDNYENITINIDKRIIDEFYPQHTQKSLLLNQNDKDSILNLVVEKKDKIQTNLFGKEKFIRNKKLHYSFLIKPFKSGFLYYTSEKFGFFSKKFLKGFVILLKKQLTKTKTLSNKIFLCKLHKNQNFIVSKLKVLTDKISFFIKMDKKTKKKQIFINQKFILPIKIKYAKNKNKKTNQNTFSINKKKEDSNTTASHSTKKQIRDVFRKDNSSKFTVK